MSGPSAVSPVPIELVNLTSVLPYAQVPRTGGVWLEEAATALLVVHALLGVALLGATTHDAILVVGYLRGRFGRVALEKIYVRIQVVAYVATFVLGAVLYPAYRIYVRAEVFEPHVPWAVNLFDIEENLAALGLPLVIGYAWLSRVLDPRRDSTWRPLYAALGLSLAAIVWFNVVAGLVLVAERGL